jgi:hypothetical protein
MYSATAYSGYTDPLTYLRSTKAVKYYDICDYINLSPPVHYDTPAAESDVNSIIDHIVKVRSGPVRPKLEDVTVEQWALANTRIMDMVFNPVSEAVHDYWAYTAKILRLFMAYDRVGVLQYDREYRMMQASNGFRWGADWSFMLDINLKTPQKSHASTAQAAKSRAEQPRSDQSRGNKPRSSQPDPCLQFNDVKGCSFGRRCIYQHVCSTCKARHPKFAHPRGQEGTSPTPVARADYNPRA